MFSFIKNALTELEHVVWPTQAESKKYMTYTVGVIIVMATLLAVLGYVIRGSLVGVRDQFDHTAVINDTSSGDDVATEADLKKLQEEFKKKKAALSGSTVSVETVSGETASGIIMQ